MQIVHRIGLTDERRQQRQRQPPRHHRQQRQITTSTKRYEIEKQNVQSDRKFVENSLFTVVRTTHISISFFLSLSFIIFSLSALIKNTCDLTEASAKICIIFTFLYSLLLVALQFVFGLFYVRRMKKNVLVSSLFSSEQRLYACSKCAFVA